MEIYTLKIKFPYDDEEIPWSRTIEVKENFTLQNFHEFIQDTVEFDDDHLYEFYIGRNPRNRYRTVPENAKLNELYPLTGFKLYYLFDFGDSWLFEITKSRKKKIADKNARLPVVIESVGENPEQYPEYDEY